MKTFELKSFNKKAFAAILITVFIILIPIATVSAPWFIQGGYGTYALIALGLVLIVGSVLLKKLLAKKYTINISEDKISILQNNNLINSSPLNQIVMLKNRKVVDGDELIFFASGQSNIFAKFYAVGQTETITAIIEEIKNHLNLEVTNRSDKAGNAWIEYINKDLAQNNSQEIRKVRDREKSSKKKTSLIVALIGIVVLGALILPFFINPKAFYENKEGKIYFGSTELVGVKPEEARTISYHVLLDSTHVYYKDQILEWADRATFQCLREPFYMDKNGVYFETSHLYKKNRIVPLEGDYDKATFQSVGKYTTTFFKDKNSLYQLEIQIIGGGDPLKKIEVPGLDIASFENLEHNYWYADKNTIYFSPWDKIRPCPDIDRASFEILSWNVAKDKNHVFYLTQNLKSDNKEATKEDGYAILEGAHAPTFVKIDERNYADKNTTWAIRNEGEEVNRRDDINY
ncbi:DKNYY domain-containing protein [Dysgonomonas sp. 520]|uniref:DKNYY domain-containing protein n=1 Tax=Dysgonomonas sp. 520 TaxID=2302931 RepID=UPI0013CFC18B|nr:DKNYY domain-containing protein [Dysgonomonas sp. 520]NDW08737.1 hypothetical protein [Dysgonomonas sp. 520]